MHECGLSFENGAEYVTAAESAVTTAQQVINETLNHALEIFLTPAIRERLRKGAADPVIAALLRSGSVAELQTYLVGECLRNAAVVETINRFLKRVVVKTIRLADFKPTSGTIERDQIAEVAQQFQRFLERELDSVREDGDAGGDILPVLQVE